MKVSSPFPTWCFFLFFISSVFLPGTEPMMSHHPNLENEKQIVLAKDWEISKVSAVSGVLRAFYPFMTEKSILLPQTGHPVQGKETCANLISRLEMDGRENVLKWEPLFAGISAAGDLAYTHGRYELPTAVNKAGDKPGDAGKQEINYGYYGTIWKKDADGTWKVAFSQGLVLLKGLN
ncbi:MAG TPA: hypothetical protein VK186_03110, partial [Candidatus Deferrimicrobium sp.]|nr:hypothetical protein [Candidatus Deferrimicrobium sp.]